MRLSSRRGRCDILTLACWAWQCPKNVALMLTTRAAFYRLRKWGSERWTELNRQACQERRESRRSSHSPDALSQWRTLKLMSKP